MTVKRYLFDTGLGGRAVIREVGNDGRPYVRLNQTWFHPQGGGQPSDRGRIGGQEVTHIAHAPGGEVNHYLASTAGLVVGQEVEVAVDAATRGANARLHTGGHLVATLVEQLFPGLTAVAGHHWPRESRVEFAGASLPPPERVRQSLPDAIARAIGEDLPVRVVGDPLTSRAVQIGPHRALPCGGTHLERVGLLGRLTVTGVKVKGGRLRVSYE
jgi:Ser-tRNA(Ala) deacylase AlaX